SRLTARYDLGQDREAIVGRRLRKQRTIRPVHLLEVSFWRKRHGRRRKEVPGSCHDALFGTARPSRLHGVTLRREAAPNPTAKPSPDWTNHLREAGDRREQHRRALRNRLISNRTYARRRPA